jgi:hypothetical protein
LENRDADGIFIYNCNRLIIMFERPKNYSKEYRGIVAIVNVPYVVTKALQNKQQFAEAKEKRELVSTLNEYMSCYLNDLGKDLTNKAFWDNYGYPYTDREPPLDSKPTDRPEMPTYLKNRYYDVPPLMQCTKCLKWRKLSFNPNIILKKEYYSDEWTCKDNTDSSKKS